MGYKLCQVILSQYEPGVLDDLKAEMNRGFDRFFLLSFCLACCWPGTSARNNLRIIRQWSEVQFQFPDEYTKEYALQQGDYIPGKNVLLDVDVHHRQGPQQSRIFVTNPRFEKGRPITLGTVDEMGRVVAYPDYSWHNNQGYNCDGMTSVFRVAIDECERLWVIDTGKIGDNQYCTPQILAFDLASDQLIYRHRFNASLYTDASLFITPVVDLRGGPGDCRDTYVYVADVNDFGLVVVDVARDRSWRVKHRLFYPFPNRGSFTIEGESFELMDGVFGMALSPARGGSDSRDRYLYFHALAATTENVVSTSVLKNESFINSPNADAHAINVFPEERTSQSAAEAIDRNGNMFFGLMEPPSIWCWNTATEFSPRNFYQIALNRETLQFASGIKVVNNLKGEQELWILTCSFQKVAAGTLTSDRVNFRIHAEKISTLLKNSPCNNSPKDRNHGYHANLITPTVYRRGHSNYGVTIYH